MTAAEYAEFCPALQEAYNSPDSAIETAVCTDASGSCRCDLTMPLGGEPQTGTYTVQGNSFVDEDGDVSEFCVNGNTLSVGAVDPDSGELIVGFFQRSAGSSAVKIAETDDSESIAVAGIAGTASLNPFQTNATSSGMPLVR